MKDAKLFRQIVRFVVVGVINTGIDLIVLNVLIHVTHKGENGGFYYSLFKSISFIVALTNSYFMNKYWTFAGQGGKNKVIEISEFIIVSIFGFIINVAVASAFVDWVPVVYGLEKYWPSIGALCGTAVGLIWNFVGYKLIVFEKKRFNT